MTFDNPIPFDEALAKLRGREVLPSSFDTEAWRAVPVGIRERAFFSARVESARVLQAMQDYLQDFVAEERALESHGGLRSQGRAEFVANMRELAMREGLGRVDPETGEIAPEIDENDLTDLRSMRRLELIFDTQTEAAQEYGYWRQGQDPDVLEVYPAQRMIRVRPVSVPRPYHEAALGVVKRKDDLAYWVGLNRDFGVPWGPWGFGSGVGVEDVDRVEAVAAGAMKEEDAVKPVERELNEGLQAGVRDMSADMLAALERATGGKAAGGALRPREERFGERVLPHPSGEGTVQLDDDVYEELRAAMERPVRGEAFLDGEFPEPIRRKLAQFREAEAKEVAGAAVEESALVTRSGVFKRKTGEQASVGWNELDLRGALMTHTHPKGGTLGPDDILKTMRFEMVGVRAHAGRRAYSAAPGRRAKVFGSVAEMAAAPEFIRAQAEAWAVVNQLAGDSGLETLEQREEAATHLVWLGLERGGWITYHVEHHD